MDCIEIAQESYLSRGGIGGLCNTGTANIGCGRKHTKIAEKEVFMGFPGNGFAVASDSMM